VLAGGVAVGVKERRSLRADRFRNGGHEPVAEVAGNFGVQGNRVSHDRVAVRPIAPNTAPGPCREIGASTCQGSLDLLFLFRVHRQQSAKRIRQGIFGTGGGWAERPQSRFADENVIGRMVARYSELSAQFRNEGGRNFGEISSEQPVGQGDTQSLSLFGPATACLLGFKARLQICLLGLERCALEGQSDSLLFEPAGLSHRRGLPCADETKG